MFRQWSALPILVVLLGGCASVPTGPSVMVLPGLGKSFEQFNADDAVCRQWGLQSIGRTPGEAATASGVASAAVGTAVGAAADVSGSQYSGQEAQWRYDMAYQQCMYSKGHQIPGVPSGYRGPSGPVPAPPPASSPPALAPMPTDSGSIPPPPPGLPPPPPPGVR